MPKSITYQVKGMHCASCASLVEKKLSRLPGINRVNVNLATETAKIESARPVSLDLLNSQISPFGYQLQVGHGHGRDNQPAFPYAFLLAIVAFGFMLWEIASGQKLLPKPPGSMWQHNFFLFVLASVNLIVFGRRYLRAIPRFVRTRVADMDTLVGIGTLAAYLYSLLIDPVFFDVTAVVIGFVAYGKYLEAKSKTKTGEAIKKLLNLQVKSAIVIRDNRQIKTPITNVVAGDRILVKPGAKIPLDGIIIEGNTAVDESMITGESLPVDKLTGDKVIGGTLNLSSAVTVKITKVGSATVLAQIIRMVSDAQGSKAPIERLADRISAIFVPVVLVIAVLTLLLWLILGSTSVALASFVAVLVISCPCAMGLATPTGIIVGVGRGAQNGILIKNAESLEHLNQIDAIVLDKTGTITQGKPEVVAVVSHRSFSSDDILQIAASLESMSEHPLAEAIVIKAKQNHTQLSKVDQFTNQPGLGVTGIINQETYSVGNLKMMTALKLKAVPDQNRLNSGATPVFVANHNSLIGEIYISDQIRDNSILAINQLKQLSIKVVMATGDNQATADYIAALVGIDSVRAEVLPEDKATIVQELQQAGHQVAMVGDGINDAPALALADVGIAMSTGSDIAIESADITILHGNIGKIEQSIQLSRATMKIIKQNLFWAFVYNSIGIPLAAASLLSPIFAGAAMALSSVSVVANSLRLKSIKL